MDHSTTIPTLAQNSQIDGVELFNLLLDDGNQRPSSSDVVGVLEFAYIAGNKCNSWQTSSCVVTKKRNPSFVFFNKHLYQKVNSYVPDDNYAVNCGDSNDVTIYNRIWVGDDVNTKQYFSIIEPQTGQSSVKADALNRFPGNLTLLKDFNASLWVQNDEKTITKEYCVNVETGGERLNITFLPSNNHSDAYALSTGSRSCLCLPFSITLIPATSIIMVNVGDNQVPPSNDTAMFRNWDNDYPDYLEKQYPLSVSTGYALQLNYRNNTIPNYTAPAAVYLTARSYGMDATEDYNVTWNFEVDSQFNYMVRLHFCEFDKLIQVGGDRVFQIFIAETLAEENADVINWSGGNLVPVHKDYAVFLTTQGSAKSETVNLSIKLQRLPKNIISKHRDVILNGIEIFKISDEHNNLAGPNPKLILSPPQQGSQTQSSKHAKTTTIIVAVVAVSGLMLVASVIGIMVFQRKRISGDQERDENSWKTKTEEIRAATNNFDDVFIVGVGGFGHVYKGYIDGTTPVAIKRLKPGSQQGAKEFMNEIEMLSQLRHLHLVSLIGYCNDGVEMILVYDFMARGTLRDQMAMSCLRDDGNQRPSMNDVVGALQFALQLVEGEEEDNNKLGGTHEDGNSKERLWLPQFINMSDEGSDMRFSSTSSDNIGSQTSGITTVSASSEEQPLVSSATVFSEIGNPRAR
ncbi:Serine-threonine/tyrosine-protein kinase, catalytic domain [Sesbania bispinosa]|nr:Serine-threonine/tyrosine-protein kinase, catalytic domain [Sesbania bispinosa]